MNDDIKRILDSIKYHIEEDDWFEIEGRFLKPLLDYITNLQKENERLKELVNADNESYDIQETIINRQKSELLEQEDYKSRIEKATKDLFELKDMIYKPETRDENIPIQQKISSIIKQLNGKE